MLKDLFRNRLFIGALAFFIFCVGGSLLYMQHVEKQSSRELAETPPPTAEVSPVGDTSQGGHWHGDEWHAQPHAPVEVSAAEVSDVQAADDTPLSEAYLALRETYPEQTNNPSPFENVPVDLLDFEATKKAFMDHFNFYVAQGGNKPEVFESRREVRIAFAVMEGLHNAAKPWVGLYTPEQRAEIHEMHRSLRRFNGVKVNHDRVWQLVHDDGYSVLEALDISREEDSNR